MKWILAASLFVLSCLFPRVERVAFVDVNVVPMDREVVLPAQTVVVEDGKIVSIGPVDRVRIPSGARRIEGTGKFLMPGLADMHVHLVGPQYHESLSLLFVANGVTTVRNMWGTPDVLRLRERITSGEVLGPRIFTSGPITDGEPPVWPTSRVVKTRAEAEAAVRSDARAGYDAVKVYSHLSMPAYRAMTAAARRHGLPVWGHIPDVVGLEGAFAAGQRSVEHLQGYVLALQDERSPLRRDPKERVDETLGIEHVDLSRLPALVRATRAADVWNSPSLVVHQNIVSGERAARLQQKPSMEFVPPAIRAMWEPIRAGWLAEFSAADYERYRRLDDLMLRITGALHAGGARLLLGTDAPNPYVVPGFSVHEELQNLVAAGLTPYEALRAGTAGPAEFLGRAEEFGTVAVGRRADLLLLEANPLEDVAHAARRAGVMLGGTWYPEALLQQRLRRMAEGFPAEELRVAAYTGNVARIEALLARGAPVDSRDAAGLTPLMVASFAGHPSAVRVFLRGGAVVDARNDKGQTALMMAAYAGHARAVEALLEGGAGVDVPDRTGLTPLMAAAYAGKADVVRVLLRGGADPGLRNRRGQTALDLARHARHREVVRLLREAAGGR